VAYFPDRRQKFGTAFDSQYSLAFCHRSRLGPLIELQIKGQNPLHQFPRIASPQQIGNYGETCVMDFGHYSGREFENPQTSDWSTVIHYGRTDGSNCMAFVLISSADAVLCGVRAARNIILPSFHS